MLLTLFSILSFELFFLCDFLGVNSLQILSILKFTRKMRSHHPKMVVFNWNFEEGSTVFLTLVAIEQYMRLLRKLITAIRFIFKYISCFRLVIAIQLWSFLSNFLLLLDLEDLFHTSYSNWKSKLCFKLFKICFKTNLRIPIRILGQKQSFKFHF